MGKQIEADLYAIVLKHTVVGGYPNTKGIAEDAFALGVASVTPTDSAVDVGTLIEAITSRRSFSDTHHAIGFNAGLDAAVAIVRARLAGARPVRDGEVGGLVERLRGLLAKATEPEPQGIDHFSHIERIVVFQQWDRRKEAAKDDVVAALPTLLSALDRAREAGEVVETEQEKQHAGAKPQAGRGGGLANSTPATIVDDAAEGAARAIAEVGHIDLSMAIHEAGGIVAAVALFDGLDDTDERWIRWRVPQCRGIVAYARAALAAMPMGEEASASDIASVWAQAEDNHRRYSDTGDREGDIRFLTLGLTGEAGEVANFVKKRWRDGDGHDEAIRHEIADVCAYAFMLANTMGMSPADLIATIAEKQQVFAAKMIVRDALSHGEKG